MRLTRPVADSDPKFRVPPHLRPPALRISPLARPPAAPWPSSAAASPLLTGPRRTSARLRSGFSASHAPPPHLRPPEKRISRLSRTPAAPSAAREADFPPLTRSRRTFGRLRSRISASHAPPPHLRPHENRNNRHQRPPA